MADRRDRLRIGLSCGKSNRNKGECAYMNGYERMDAALHLQKVDRVPVFPIHHYSSTRVTGVKIRKYATDPEVMADCLIRAADYMGYDAVLAGSDVAIEGEACGGICEQPEDAPAHIIKPVIQELEDLDRLRVPDPLTAGRMPVVVRATELVKRALGDKLCVAATVMGPMNVAGQLRGVEDLMFDIMDEPEFFERLLDFSLEVSLTYAKKLIDAGADQIQAGEALCSPNFINPKAYREFILPRQKIWAKELNSYGSCRSTLIHVCGDIRPILADLGTTGATCLDVDYAVSMKEARELGGVAVRGNIDPSSVIMQGTPEQVELAAKAVLDETRGMTGIILGTGCDVPPVAPNENVRMLTVAAERYGRY